MKKKNKLKTASFELPIFTMDRNGNRYKIFGDNKYDAIKVDPINKEIGKCEKTYALYNKIVLWEGDSFYHYYNDVLKELNKQNKNK